MSDLIYCGSKETIPLGKTRIGTETECIKKNQIREYGIKQLDPKMIKEMNNIKTNITMEEKYMRQLMKTKRIEYKINKIRRRVGEINAILAQNFINDKERLIYMNEKIKLVSNFNKKQKSYKINGQLTDELYEQLKQLRVEKANMLASKQKNK